MHTRMQARYWRIASPDTRDGRGIVGGNEDVPLVQFGVVECWRGCGADSAVFGQGLEDVAAEAQERICDATPL